MRANNKPQHLSGCVDSVTLAPTRNQEEGNCLLRLATAITREPGDPGVRGRSSLESNTKSRQLLVVGSNPATTDGRRTLGRVEQARQVLGFDEVNIANIFSLPTYRSGNVSEVGISPDGWQEARGPLEEDLDRCDAVLLAYGVAEPSGVARRWHRQQIEWLEAEIAARLLPVWWVGEAPRHPSRWQRYTFRCFPNLDYQQALRHALQLRTEQAAEGDSLKPERASAR